MSGQGQDNPDPTLPVDNSTLENEQTTDDRLTTLRNHRKQLRGKLTRSINRVQTAIRKGETDSIRLRRELKQISNDYEQCSFVHGEIYEHTDQTDHSRLDQWEAELNNDFFSIEEIVNEHLRLIGDPISTQSVSHKSSQQSESLSTSSTSQGHVPVESTEKTTQPPQSPSKSVEEEASNVLSTFVSETKPRSQVKTVDSWIDELREFEETVHKDNVANLSMSELLYRLEGNRDIPVIKIDPFDGEPQHYVEFVQRFKIHIHDKVHLLDEVRLAQLKMHLTGEAKKTLSGIGLSGNMYATALKTIKEQFGEPSRIARSYISKLTKGPKIYDKFGLKDLSINIINAIANLKLLCYFDDINSSDTLRQIVERLPNYLLDRWKTKSGSIRMNGEKPTIHHMNTFLRTVVRAEFDPDFGDIRRSGPSKSSPVQSSQFRKSVNSTSRMNSGEQRYVRCSLCQGDHRLPDCNKFKDLDIKRKFEHVTSQHLCFACLTGGHNIFHCRRKNPCGIDNCQRFHNKLLHSEPLVSSSVLDRRSMLPVVRVLFKAPNGRILQGNVLIDSGSGTTAIRTSLSKDLGLQGRRERVDISVVGGHQFSQNYSRRVRFKIVALDGVEEFNIEAHELDNTITDVPDIDRQWLQSFNHLNGINFSQTSGPIDLILGVQYTHLHFDLETRIGLPYEPLAKRSLLGWFVIGPVKSSSSQLSAVTICHVEKVNFEKFYEFESLGVKAVDCQCPKVQISRQDKQALESFESTCHKIGGRYEIGLPWRRDPKQLPNNYDLAEKRLISLEKGLRKDPVKARLYNDVMEDYVKNGWSQKLSQEEIDQQVSPVYYLPHHGVYRPEKVSTPLRIVLDPAHEYRGVSLNSFLLKGPCLIGNLFAVLLRFREDPVGIVGDISKMFLQVLLPEQDSQVHRFLWRNLDVTKKPDIYRLLRVTFGDKSSPDMASFVMNRIASEHQSEFPEAAAIIQRDRYMDDLIHSCQNQSEADKRIDELNQLLQTGKFQIKEWYCSSKSTSSVNEVNLDGENELKTLGLGWNPVRDILKFTVKPVNVNVFTKRIVLSKMSTLFDPLGLATPVTVKMRMAMQEIWRNKQLDWDDRLSEEDSRIWSILFDEMYCLNNLSFPRCLKSTQAYGESELHVFCDASLKAYGAVVYIVWSTSNGREVQLVTSKVRVSPLRQSTIPRLELMAALIGCRLAKTVTDELKAKPDKVVIWSDSHVVLHWIGSESVNMKPFVGVRVTEIQSTWKWSNFKYVPTELNPADDLSRGLTVDRMTERWMSGPGFLKRHESDWPVQPTSSPVIDESELRKVKPLFAIVQSLSPVTDPHRFSSYSRLLRVTAFCRRFIEKLKAKVKSSQLLVNGNNFTGQLTSEEVNESEEYWIKVTQSSLSDQENFKDLCPFVENGLVRVGGRLRHIALSYDQRHPVLLPQDHHVTELIIREHHRKSCHAGAERTLADIRQKFWIPHGRKVVKKVVKSCVICRKLRQSPCETLMGDFPSDRLKPLSPPFTTTGVDLFGPFLIKYGRNKSIKAWGAIFTCSTTRAIHLEIVQDLSTQSFLFALRRFSAHHGWPKTFISDNGSNFIGAEKELEKLFKDGRKQIEEFVVVHRVAWKFITPLSPHQGGFYESLIKQVKKNLKVIIGHQVLSWNEMSTVFVEVENLVNSRPLGYLSDSPNDTQPITPNHFLMGRATPEIPSGPFEETKDLRKRFLFVQTLVTLFWQRFVKEYFPTLQRRSKWLNKGRQMQVGDIVLLTDNCARAKWNMGRVINVFPGKDGIIRNVEVKNQYGQYKRSIQKCVLILES